MRKIIYTIFATVTLSTLCPVLVQADTLTKTEAATAQESSTDEFAARYKYATSTINIRQEPSTESEVIGKLSPSNPILVIGEVMNGEEIWDLVQLEGCTAYIRGDLLHDTQFARHDYTEDDLYVLTHALTGECHTYSDYEQRLVASVIVNRMNRNSRTFPGTSIKEIVFQKGQYACTWDGNYNRTPTERNWENARFILENGSVMPPNVVYQAGFKQGSSVYLKTDKHTYCYE